MIQSWYYFCRQQSWRPWRLARFGSTCPFCHRTCSQVKPSPRVNWSFWRYKRRGHVYPHRRPSFVDQLLGRKCKEICPSRDPRLSQVGWKSCSARRTTQTTWKLGLEQSHCIGICRDGWGYCRQQRDSSCRRAPLQRTASAQCSSKAPCWSSGLHVTAWNGTFLDSGSALCHCRCRAPIGTGTQSCARGHPWARIASSLSRSKAPTCPLRQVSGLHRNCRGLGLARPCSWPQGRGPCPGPWLSQSNHLTPPWWRS